MQQWVEKISAAINLVGGGGGASTVSTGGATTSETQVTSPRPSSTSDAPTPAAVAPRKEPPVESNLDAAKRAIPFLADEQSKVLEFWSIWHESVPSPTEMEEFDEGIEYQLAIAAGMQKLTWRAAGPQSALIQRMVDFFWNVGAPETEIDKLNEVGASVNPKRIGSWIDMSSKGGMDGGWFFPVENSTDLSLTAGDAGESIDAIQTWAVKHDVTVCNSVGRDMGAAPPRQTEFIFHLPGTDVNAQTQMALDAVTAFGFPPISPDAEAILRASVIPEIGLSVISSSQGFVRVGILVPRPDEATVDKLCAISRASPDGIHELETAIKSSGPQFAELQYLMEGFGYGVYEEGFDIVFHYSMSQNA